MPLRKLLAVTTIILCSALAPAKDKKKTILPVDVLRARTVLVVVDPTAGVDARDPNANRAAPQISRKPWISGDGLRSCRKDLLPTWS